MKKLALISSFCDDINKIDILKKNIDILKSEKIDILLISPFFLDEEVQSKCDYFFQTKDNPVYDWPKKAIYMWREIYISDRRVVINKTIPDYGWAGLFQVKQLCDIGLTLDYDYYYNIIYDLKIDDNVMNYLRNPQPKMIFPSTRGGTYWNVGLHFMIFNRDNLSKFKNLISEESYLTNIKDNAFDWLEKVAVILNCDTNVPPVEDEIFYYEGLDIFNYSRIKNLKFFIEKNDQTKESVKIFFYDVSSENPVEIIVNSRHTIFNLKENIVIDLEINTDNIDQLVIGYLDQKQNVLEDLVKIKHNTLYFE